MDTAAVRAESQRLRGEAQRLRDVAVARTNEALESARERRVGGRGEDLSLRLPRMDASVAVARTAVERWLDARGVPADDAFDVVLATSEACANAVEHPRAIDRPAFLVTGRCRDASIEIFVRDFGRWRGESSDRTRGRGIAMIRKLMDEVVIRETAAGTGLWMSRRYSGTST